MRGYTALKIAGGIVAVLLGLTAIAWLVWVPFAKEAGYVFVGAWGTRGSAPGQFNDPTGIAVTETEVFVSDARNGRIQVFDLDGKFKRQFGTQGDGPGQLGRPMNLAIAGDELYVADYWNDRIQVFAHDGTPRRLIGRPGSGPGEFDAPGGVAVAANGDLFVADFYNQRIQHLRADGSFIKQWGKTGKPGRWAMPIASRCFQAKGVFCANGVGPLPSIFLDLSTAGSPPSPASRSIIKAMYSWRISITIGFRSSPLTEHS
jgi:hypothetical protein